MYIIPNPKKIEEKQGIYTIYYQDGILIDSSWGVDADFSAGLLREEVEKQTGFHLPVTRSFLGTGSKAKGIYLLQKKELGQQAYELRIERRGITVSAGTVTGLLYGVQSLRQIIRQAGASIPCLEVADEPDFENRGYYHDVTRGRIPTLSYLKELADRLSFYKINQLQLYIEHSFLFSGLSEVWRDDTPLTPEDIMELDAYCRERCIELVPSLSSFGHLYKLLSTKTYAHLCELPDAEKAPFSFWDRMRHHTLDITSQEGMKLIQSLIEEFMPLFSSDQFNICGDETFDLGKGRSKPLADEIGVERMYIQFVKQLCEFLKAKGKRPMFWGDVICGFPELIKELPEETICLNWGYAPEQNEDSSRKLSEAGAVQYSCPGVAGWNQFVNLMEPSYRNIKRMCGYASQYQAIGVLNTDWGDFGHINHPSFGICGMIYGAAFSWNADTPCFEELNRQISWLEYQDTTGSFAALAAQIPQYSIFQWEYAVRFLEMKKLGATEEEQEAYFKENDVSGGKAANASLEELKQSLSAILIHMGQEKRTYVKAYLIAIEGQQIFNEIGLFLARKKYQSGPQEVRNGYELAAWLETWFYHYKQLWRSVSRESELYRIQEVINAYGDMLRELE